MPAERWPSDPHPQPQPQPQPQPHPHPRPKRRDFTRDVSHVADWTTVSKHKMNYYQAPPIARTEP